MLHSHLRRRGLERLTIRLPFHGDIPPIEIDSVPHCPFQLGAIFERDFFHSERNRTGTFYTPRDLATIMVKRALQRTEEDARILDPACGSGVFLLAAARELIQHRGNHVRTLSRLYGCDLNPLASFVTQILLEAEAAEQGIELDLTDQVVTGNFLLDAIFSQTHFNLVIGNPPFGLSRDEQMSPEENRSLKLRYSSVRDGKVNKYMAFIAEAWERLAPEGHLSFVVPNSWLGIKGGRKLRRHLLSSGNLEHIHVLTERVFQDPSLEVVVFSATRSIGEDITISTGPVEDFLDPVSNRTTRVSAARCLEDPDARIPLLWSNAIEALISHISKNTIPLGDTRSPCIPQIALQAYSTGKGTPAQTRRHSTERTFHASERVDDSYHPYLQGGDVGRYMVQWSGQWLSHGPWLAEHPPLHRFQGPRIVLREILGSPPYLLKAVLLTDTTLYNRSLLHILPKEACATEDLLVLLGILNSSLISSWILLRGRKSQRSLFPKVVLDDLRDIPLPQDLLSGGRNLASLVRAQMNHPCVERDRAIDNEVYAMYLLSRDHIEIVETLLSAPLPWQRVRRDQ